MTERCRGTYLVISKHLASLPHNGSKSDGDCYNGKSKENPHLDRFRRMHLVRPDGLAAKC